MESTDARISCQKITQNTLPNHEMSEKILNISVQISRSISMCSNETRRKKYLLTFCFFRFELPKLSHFGRSSVQGLRTCWVFFLTSSWWQSFEFWHSRNGLSDLLILIRFPWHHNFTLFQIYTKKTVYLLQECGTNKPFVHMFFFLSLFSLTLTLFTFFCSPAKLCKSRLPACARASCFDFTDF